MPSKIVLSITKSCDASGPIKLHAMPLKIDIYISISVAVTEHNKYQGVKEFHMLARIGCFKNYGFQSF